MDVLTQWLGIMGIACLAVTLMGLAEMVVDRVRAWRRAR